MDPLRTHFDAVTVFNEADDRLKAMARTLTELGQSILDGPETTVVTGVSEEGPRSALTGAKRFFADKIPDGNAMNKALRERSNARVARDHAWAALSEDERRLLATSGPLIP